MAKRFRRPSCRFPVSGKCTSHLGFGLVVEGDTLVVTHIDRLSRGLTYGLQVIEDLHHAGVEFRSLSEDFDTATGNRKLQLQMVLAFSEWWRNSIMERSVAGQAKARTEGRFPGRRPKLTERQREYIREERSRNLAGNPDSPQAVVFLTSIIDETEGIATYYMYYCAI